MKKHISLALCLCLILGLAAGCGGSKIEYYDEEPTETADAAPAETAEAAEAVIAIGTGGTGFDTYPADTVVATIDGSEATWMEYYYWLSYYVPYALEAAAQYGLSLTSWDANEMSSSDTNAQVVLRNVYRNLLQDHVMLAKAEELGITLSDEDEAELLALFEQNADAVMGDGDGECTEEEAANYELYLEQQNVDREFFNYVNSLSILSDSVFVATYGAQGENLSDEETLAFAEDNGLMAAKHILLLTVDMDTREPLTDEEIEAKRETAEELLARLEPVKDDPEALAALFDELTAEYTEDTGYALYPQGYVFSEGQMVSAFEDAVKELDEYGLSGIVESEYGYHIILRIPIDPDAVTGTNSVGTDVTLRYAAAAELFSRQIETWAEEADVVWTDGFETPDFDAIFG